MPLSRLWRQIQAAKLSVYLILEKSPLGPDSHGPLRGSYFTKD